MTGGLFLVHSDAPMQFKVNRDYPHGPEIARAYLDQASFARPAAHRPWGELPEWSRYDDTPEHRAWRESPEGSERGPLLAPAVGSTRKERDGH